jgi:serine/threonine-protein kinase
MSPEQCEGKGLIDHRSDVYSLGIVMYELLTGCVPFPGEGFGEVLVAHLTKQPAKPTTVNPNIPAGIESIVMHAIEKDRNRRFQNMNEFLAAVENPDEHHAKWTGLPDYSSAPTQQTMPKATAQPKQGRTLALDDVGLRSAGGGPRPTTLEGAAAEVTLSPTRVPRNRAPVIAVVAAVLALGGVGGYFALSGKKKSDDGQTTTETPTTTAVTPRPTPETAPEAKPQPEAHKPVAGVDDIVSVFVTSDPPGAKVYRADKSEAETELTPLTFKLHKGDPPFDIQLRLEGHLSATRTITSDESVKMLVSLAKVPGSMKPVATAPKHEEPPPEAQANPASKEPRTPKVSNVASPPRRVPAAKTQKAPKATTPTDDDMTIIQPNF